MRRRRRRGAQPDFPHGARADRSPLRIIAPAAPGGGWDQTARAMQQVLQRERLVRWRRSRTFRARQERSVSRDSSAPSAARGDMVMVSGLIMLGGIVTHRSPVTLGDVIPIARLTGEYQVIAVPAASPFHSLQDLIAAFKAQPGVDLVGRRIGGRQRPDPGGSRCRRRRCRAEAGQLHRVLRRRRIDVGHPRRHGVGRHQRLRGIRSAARGRHASRARDLERGAAAGRRHTDAPRAGRQRRVRELALAGRPAWHQPRRPRAARSRSSTRWCSRRRGASRSHATAGSTGISTGRLRQLRGRGGSARAGDPEEARDRRERHRLPRVRRDRIRCWC